MSIKEIHQKIKAKGGRVTKARKAIVSVLFDSNCMLSSSQIISKLKEKRTVPSRTTMYRELLFLIKNNIIVKNTALKKDYFEIVKDHHHHLICLNCNSFKKIAVYNDLIKKEKEISRKNNFKIINHSFDFYGLCHKCQK
ncbi:MAG: transcriptional repressor [Candidatus Pacebacteria bacterium]|nr:transcriptional repressor [Candidatus Paceibacterota bacterium]MDD3072594.1 transcriptional repressor [Candidatus Paceibacterota bacterium]MDD3728924.1 transcriptional repressor [Candidatus Paceibacterota bacterium]MDD4201540.1 transcriptional repressor [Candidatus Paceibacterota bacterium]MDD4467243.1 transcriptional repressor [Candidatus Paceibacterota bacterium]